MLPGGAGWSSPRKLSVFSSFPMKKLTREDLLGLEQYAAQRAAFRQRLMAHKRRRRIALGEHASLHFEDRLTIQYQVQEMLRIERIFEAEHIQAELDAYNPLIPDGTNLKATLMLEYTDPQQRREALAALAGVEHQVWLQVAGHPPLRAIADEDLPRSDPHKTSAVHFLRFEFEPAMAAALRQGATLALGCEHPCYRVRTGALAADIRAALAADLDADPVPQEASIQPIPPCKLPEPCL